MKELSQLIADHPLFEGIPLEYTEALTSCAQEGEYGEGSFLTLSGSSAETFFIILEGTVSIQVQPPHNSPITILTLGEGDTLGWSWIFPPYAWHFDAHATSPTKVIAFDAESVREKCDQDHELGYKLMKRIAQVMLDRLVATRLQLLDLYG
ncbi:Crp/Fnr family transcriptional regulator [Pelagicoccus mobilis]|uniref:Cyclic nucleotide-binding domain-containing protein n=1 Tax=Pelagicoccus mobilis TaxID=415221 RepID=A0A934RXL9_9BACT|nr:cyclic nucleotide-binding domain-containing protein [Pelagicoccus mobilis]MBK1876237.1 cyclic nucleotide-binding domain-containing protein [Pelagicoccus mobilis]